MNNYAILKKHCKYITLVGSGNFWYEKGVLRDDRSFSYKLFSVVLLSTYAVMTVLEIMAALVGELPDDEKSDSVTFAVSHTIVMIKILSVISKKELIKELNEKMIKACEQYERPEHTKQKYRVIKINVVSYFIGVYGCVAFFVFEGLRKMFTGSHFITIVTYYPDYEDDSLPAVCFRILTTVVLVLMMSTMMVSVDAFTVMYLIMYKYKFVTLRHYFDELKEEFDRQSQLGDIDAAADKLTNGIAEGIAMHQMLLGMAKDIDSAFGIVMAFQVCQSSGSAVSLLLQIALSDQLTLTASMKIITFVAALFFLLAVYLCNAGEITYQASLLGNSIFYCGWYAFPAARAHRRRARSLVLQACMQAQRPPVMMAFKMIKLTYATFVQVVRVTYSVFALFYTQRK